MKRADLKPGTDYLVSSENDWDAYGGYHRPPTRVRVLTMQELVDTTPQYGYMRGGPLPTLKVTAHDGTVYDVPSVRERRQYDRVTDVLVLPLEDDGSPRTRHGGKPAAPRLVPVRQVRATWDEGFAKVQHNAALKAKHAKDTSDREAAREAQFQAMLPALESALAGQQFVAAHDVKRKGTLTLTLDQVQALLDAR